MTKRRASESYRLFRVETSFETKTKQPGGVGRSDAVAAAEASIREMQESIEMTIDEKLTSLEAALSKIDVANGDLPGQIRAMHDLASILRDLGGVVGFNLVTYVSESLCKFLYLFESRGGFEETIVDCHLKTIRLVRGEHYRKLEVDDAPQLKAGFDGMFQKIAAQHSY